MTRTHRLFAATFVLALAACSKPQEPPAEKAPATAPSSPASAAAAIASGPAAAPAAKPADGNAPIYHPEKATEKAPDKFKVKFTTSKGDFTVEVTRAWSPNGADRFYNLVKLGFFDDVKFFRAIEGFMVQFGLSGNPSVNGAWADANIPDDPPAKGVSNKRGFVTFAKTGMPNSRSTQLFINYSDGNARLDAMGFTPFGEVNKEGMAVVDSLYKGYGEGAPMGRGPDQGRARSEGNAYLEKEFPKLDFVKSATLVK